ncbi:MAG: hypothetical protein GY847_25900 [Proteobacteria bacterium]|nr:hypothetical protein [Pseudomonadota bacterium]
MTNANLKAQIAEAAMSFTLNIIEAVKAASLQELMELQIAGMIAKPTRKKPGPKPKAKKSVLNAKPGPIEVIKNASPRVKSKSITKKEKAELHDKIIAFLSKNPWSSGGKICKEFTLNPWTARRLMKQLADAGKVEVTGEKSKTRYGLKA